MVRHGAKDMRNYNIPQAGMGEPLGRSENVLLTLLTIYGKYLLHRAAPKSGMLLYGANMAAFARIYLVQCALLSV